MNKAMKKIATSLLLGASLMVSGMASASFLDCYKVTINNQSDGDVTGVWGAQGCAGVYDSITETCEHKNIKPGSSSTYTYKWGTTLPTVRMHFPGWNGYSTIYMYWNGRFLNYLAGGSPACGHHYTIDFTQSDYDEAEYDAYNHL